MRGRNSSPLDIERTYAMCAALRGSTIAEVAGIVAANARILFGASKGSSA
jgi:Tat protein secretion system quality control protein TatD with DNase activity